MERLTSVVSERMFPIMAHSNLTEERLDTLERGARERHTLMDRLVIELISENRLLRRVIARFEGPATDLPKCD